MSVSEESHYESLLAGAEARGEVEALLAEVDRFKTAGVDLVCRLVDAEAEIERLREALRISYPKTPVDCLISTLSELWNCPWDWATNRAAVLAHVRHAVEEARQALAQSKETDHD